MFDRAGGSAQLNNYTWPQWVNTIKPPQGDALAKGTYRPLLAPVNFLDSKKGTEFFTIWYSGPLSIRNERGRFEFIPSNLQRFTPFHGTDKTVPADPALPDYKRDVQFTVNGQFQPVVKSKAGQTEIWVLANVSDVVYTPVQLTETATGNHPKIAIVGQDGVPYPEVHHPVFENGTKLLIPPATRYAIAVTMPEEGDLILEMPPRGGGASTISAPGVLYTNDGTEESAGGARQRERASPGRELLRRVLRVADASSGEGDDLRRQRRHHGVQGRAEARRLYRVRGHLPGHARRRRASSRFRAVSSTIWRAQSDAKSFTYVFEGIEFPYVPLLQPRLGSIEEWKFLNNNNDEHPIHIHVNDFQVTLLSRSDEGH